MSMGAFSVSALVATAVAIAAPQDGAAIASGPMAGMFRGPPLVVEGRTLGTSLLPSPTDAAPPSAAIAAALRAILDAEAAGDIAAAQDAIAPNATMRFCPAQTVDGCRPAVAFAGFAIPGTAQANTPYALGNGIVRVEWISEGRAAYVSFARFVDGKLAVVRTGPALIPVSGSGE